jgi:Rieske 2Fe-2S family protein
MGTFKEFDGGLTQTAFNQFSCCYFTNDFGVMFSFKPQSISETEVELIWLVDQNAKENIDYNIDDISYIWHTTTLADTRIIENNYKGLMSKSFEPGVLSKTETGITYFYNWYFNCMKKNSNGSTL